MTGAAMSKEQAAAAVKAAVAERDAIQANLLELDSSFGKQLLAGAELTGTTKRRWDAISATLGTLWQIFEAYSAVVDQAVFADSAAAGSGAFTGLVAGVAVLALAMAAGCAWGLSRRLAEYR